MPYWDWAAPLQAGDSVLPASLQTETVQVVTPSSAGKTIKMKNPLYSFEFHPLNPAPGDFPLKNVSRVVCCPTCYTTPIDNLAPLNPAKSLHPSNPLPRLITPPNRPAAAPSPPTPSPPTPPRSATRSDTPRPRKTPKPKPPSNNKCATCAS